MYRYCIDVSIMLAMYNITTLSYYNHNGYTEVRFRVRRCATPHHGCSGPGRDENRGEDHRVLIRDT